jgi:DNA-binding NarL/FixJ family response regulator
MTIFDIKDKIDRLTFKEQLIIYLVSCGYTLKEIAKIMETSYTNIKQRCYQMKKKFK